MIDRLDELHILLEVMSVGSMRGAARKLAMSPPTVTRAISSLEEKLQCTLFLRSTRHLVPTPAAVSLQAAAKRLVADYQAAVTKRDLSALEGRIRITAPVQFGRICVGPAIWEFLKIHSGVEIDLMLDDRNLDLRDEQIDLAVRIGKLRSSELKVQTLGYVRHVLTASPAYIRAKGLPSHPHQLGQHDIIFGTSRPVAREWRFGGDRKFRVRLEPRLTVDDVETQKEAVRAGVGIGRFLSYQVAEDLAQGRLIRLMPEHEPSPLPAQILHHSSPFESRLVAECRLALRSRIRTNLPR